MYSNCSKLSILSTKIAIKRSKNILTFLRSMMNGDYEPQPKTVRYMNGHEENRCEDQKHVPFKPRLLRAKRKENESPKRVFNNNQDEWLKHRRELDIDQSR